jgi:ATP-dependent Clp protease ATP-binding subunit ClpC
MLQIFDEGHLTDGQGRRVDFRNTIIILTSNIGSRQATEHRNTVGYHTPTKESNIALTPQAEYHKALESTFSPEFLNRIDDIIYFRTLTMEDIRQIIDIELELILQRASEQGYRVEVTHKARQRLATLGYEARYGVRALKRTLIDKVEEPLSALIIDGELVAGGSVTIDSDTKQEITLSVA